MHGNHVLLRLGHVPVRRLAKVQHVPAEVEVVRGESAGWPFPTAYSSRGTLWSRAKTQVTASLKQVVSYVFSLRWEVREIDDPTTIPPALRLPAAVDDEIVAGELGVEEARHLLDWVAVDGRGAGGGEGHGDHTILGVGGGDWSQALFTRLALTSDEGQVQIEAVLAVPPLVLRDLGGEVG